MTISTAERTSETFSLRLIGKGKRGFFMLLLQIKDPEGVFAIHGAPHNILMRLASVQHEEWRKI
jgi:hypothetical protein